VTEWTQQLALAEAVRARDRGWRPFPVDHPHAVGAALDAKGNPTGCSGAHKRPDWLQGMPCDGKRGKHPAVKFKDSAATSTAQGDGMLASWFTRGGEPRNVGIACGASGLIILDSDEPGAFERMAVDLGHELPRTYRVRTSADWHWYFDASDHPDIGNAEGLLAAYGINVRGKGGYVVGAGSLHASGRIYAAEDPDAPVAPLPAWIAQAIATKVDGGEDDGETFDGDQDAPRFIDQEQALVEFYEAVATIQHQGNTFRQDELFPAALDGWRCVDNGWLTERQMKLALKDAIWRVWNADPDAADIQIINVEARKRADRSPWLPHPEVQEIGTAPPEPPPVVGPPENPMELGDAPVDVLSDPDAGTADPADAFVELAYTRLKARRIAERRLDAEEAGEPAPPTSTTLRDLLAEPDESAPYLIAGLWPIGGKVILSAQQKAGKTTMVGNLLRSVVDGDPLLGPRPGTLVSAGAHPGFPVDPLGEDEAVFVADFELDRRMIRRWLRDHRIRNGHRVHIETFRGQTWDMRDDRIRAQWARHLRDLNVRVIILDPLAPVLSSLNIDEIDNKGVGQFLHAMDALVAEAGAGELLITHHTTHDGERGRGASVLRGWPDAEWRFVVERPENGGEPEPGAARFFAATGRDVAEPERALAFEAETRTLSVAGGSRTAHAVDRHSGALVDLVKLTPGIAKRDLIDALKGGTKVRSETAAAVIMTAVKAGLIHVHNGPNRSLVHYPEAPNRGCAHCWDEGLVGPSSGAENGVTGADS
jgi:hypothetical protein